jgi:hypothetical protein
MLSRSCAWVTLVCAALSLGQGCKNGDQQTRPLPPPEPPAAASAAALPRDDSAPAPKKRAVEKAVDVAQPAEPSAPAAVAPVAPATTDPAAPPASAVAQTAAPSAQLPAPSAQCVSRCQNAMQGCLSAPVDGGVPGFSNLDLCKKAFEACQSACAKQ